jgi:ribose transport system substrate-binding protein
MFRQITFNKLAIILLLLAILVGGFILLNSYREYNNSGNEPLFVLIPKSLNPENDFWRTLIGGAMIGANEFEVELVVLGAYSEDDIMGQNQKILEAISLDPAVILLAASSATETTPYIEKAIEAGIHVILVDSGVDKEIGSGIVSTNNIEIGQKLSDYARGFLSYESVIGIIGPVQGAATAIEREKGIREGLREYEDNIITVVYGAFNYDLAYQLTKQMMIDYPEINIIFGMNEDSSSGAARAIYGLGLAGEVMLFGVDNSLEQVQFLERGVFQAIVIQKPANMGYLAVEQGVDILSGRNVGEQIDTGSVLINQENMRLRENQQLLFPLPGQ